MRMCLVPALLLSGLLAGVAGAAIPVDHYDDLTLDAPVENRLRAGDPLRIAGHVDDAGIGAIVFTFETDAGQSLDFWFLVNPDGSFEREIVFLEHQTGSYHVHAFAGPVGESIPHKGTYSQVVVDGIADTIAFPAGYFDGIRLDEPLPRVLPVGRTLWVSGAIVDPRVRQLRFDLTGGAGERSVSLPHEGGRFTVPVRFTGADTGPVSWELVTGLADGNYWGRGTAETVLEATPLPRLVVPTLAASLRPGEQFEVPLHNAGDAQLMMGAPEITAPFVVVDTPRSVSAGARGAIRLRHDGGNGATGLLTVHSDDPVNPHIEIPLTTLRDGSVDADWTRATGPVPIGAGEQIVALYALPEDGAEGPVPFVLGNPPPALSAAAAHRPAATARDRGEALLREKERALARRVAAEGLPPTNRGGAARPLAAHADVGDQRNFVFDEFLSVPAQRVPATVVAVSERGVAWAHDGSGAGSEQLPTPQIQAMLDRFDADYPMLTSVLGSPSDVDGDGRIHFLYTPLVDSVGFGGFVDASSILPFQVGGNGNHTDLIFIALDEPASSYRALLAHEFQHLISFNQHVFVRFGESEVSWLNEGLSHVTEDLVDGYARGGNADRAGAYLADPAAVGLVGDAATSGAKRGAAYLFVRSLVDRFGVSVLSRLVGTGLADVDNLEHTTGLPFEALLAGFAAQLAASGTDLGQHPRYDYTFEGLAPAGGRGFAAPRMDVVDGSAGLSAQVPARGLRFVRVTSEIDRSMVLQAADGARLTALVLPTPPAYEIPVHAPVDFFRLLTLDTPLPTVIGAGQALRVAGRIDTGLFPAGSTGHEVVLEYQEGSVFPSFATAVVDGRFERDLVFAGAEAGEYALNVFARWSQDDAFGFEWLGTFRPARVLASSRAVLLPRLYFDRVRLDAPLPTQLQPHGTLALGGDILDRPGAPVLERIQLDLAGAADTLTLRMQIADGRFDGSLELVEQPLGTYTLNLFGQTVDDEFLWLGGTDYFEITEQLPTAIADAGDVAPARFDLGDAYPNPFNGSVTVPFQLADAGPVRLTVYSITGQRVARHAADLSAGTHAWRWDARDVQGRPVSSGVYVIEVAAAGDRLQRKVVYLR